MLPEGLAISAIGTRAGIAGALSPLIGFDVIVVEFRIHIQTKHAWLDPFGFNVNAGKSINRSEDPLW